MPEAVANSLDQLHQVATALRKWRREHALLSGDRPEFRLRLDENKRIRLIDPLQNISAVRDIACTGSKVVRIAENIPASSGRDSRK